MRGEWWLIKWQKHLRNNTLKDIYIKKKVYEKKLIACLENRNCNVDNNSTSNWILSIQMLNVNGFVTIFFYFPSEWSFTSIVRMVVLFSISYSSTSLMRIECKLTLKCYYYCIMCVLVWQLFLFFNFVVNFNREEMDLWIGKFALHIHTLIGNNVHI